MPDQVRDDVVRHDGIAGRARNDEMEMLNQVQHDAIVRQARVEGIVEQASIDGRREGRREGAAFRGRVYRL